MAKTKKKVTKKVVKKTPAKSKLQLGKAAPGFTLFNQDGNKVSLSDFKGKKVVVYFYPKAMTPGCTTQACEITNSRKALDKAGIVVLGISADPVKKLKQFEEKQNLDLILLSDENKDVIKSYGVWGLKKFMGREFMGILRQSFLIDETGKLVHIISKVDTKTHHQEILDFFKHH